MLIEFPLLSTFLKLEAALKLAVESEGGSYGA